MNNFNKELLKKKISKDNNYKKIKSQKLLLINKYFQIILCFFFVNIIRIIMRIIRKKVVKKNIQVNYNNKKNEYNFSNSVSALSDSLMQKCGHTYI